MTSESLATITAYRGLIDDGLREFFASLPQRLDIELSAHSQKALKQLEVFCIRPGKRLRGSLAAATYDMAAGKDKSAVGIQLGVVLELIQAYLLIVDDVMDRSETRRGGLTLHRLYTPEATGYGGEHEANMLAINVGLLAQHLANVLFASLEAPASALQQGFEIMHINVAATGFGQLDDLYLQLGRKVREKDIIQKYCLKSSYYTFVNPMQLGFALAEKATDTVMTACRAFGEAAGVAFQLHDDYLGVFGEDETIGKSSLDDIHEGKYTLLVDYALRHADAESAKRLRSVLGDPKSTGADLLAVRVIMEETGAVAYNQQQEATYAERAKQTLADNALGTAPYRQALSDLVDYSITRTL